jgi:hypothetical protein
MYNFDLLGGLPRPSPIAIEEPTCQIYGFWILEYHDLKSNRIYHLIFEKLSALHQGAGFWMMAHPYENCQSYRAKTNRAYYGGPSNASDNFLVVDLKDINHTNCLRVFGDTFTRGWMTPEYARWVYQDLVSRNNFKLVASHDLKDKPKLMGTPRGFQSPFFQDYRYRPNWTPNDYAVTA